MSTALLLIAHGSVHKAANDELHGVAEELRRRGVHAMVEAAFLELAAPTIEEAGRRCVEGGADRVILLPYFLSAGRHVGEDLTRHRDALAGQFPKVMFRLAGPLGPHPGLIEILMQRVAETLRQ